MWRVIGERRIVSLRPISNRDKIADARGRFQQVLQSLKLAKSSRPAKTSLALATFVLAHASSHHTASLDTETMERKADGPPSEAHDLRPTLTLGP